MLDSAMPLRKMLFAFLVTAIMIAGNSVSTFAEEIDIVIDDFSTIFSFTNIVKVGNNTTFDDTFIMRDNGSLAWTDTGAGIYNNGVRSVLVDQYQNDGSSSGVWVTGDIVGNQINYSAGEGVRASVSLSYDLNNISLLTTEYLTFDLKFDDQAAESTRAEVTFTDGTDSTTAEISFANSTEGLNNIDLNGLQTGWDWDDATWTDINTNGLTGVTFRFFSTDFGDDFRFASQGFNATALGNTLTQVPEPTSLLMFGAILAGSGLGMRRRRKRLVV